jgi:nucleotide-binding universal stress UspA family protein
MKIVIATDGSPSASEAVEVGLELAAEQNAVPVFVHVVPEFDVLAAGGLAAVPAVRHEVSARDWEPLEAAGQLANERGLEAEEKLLLGDAGDEIIAYADAIDAEMIVVGSRGHGAFASAVLGSGSRGVLHHAQRPVLIVRNTHRNESDQLAAASPAPA